MEHLLTNITGLDMALCLGLLLVYIWSGPDSADQAGGLDRGDVDW